MTSVIRDSNHVPALVGTSNSDGISPVVIWADPTSHRALVDTNGVASGAGAPASTPAAVGLMYIDTTGAKVYISTATVNSGSWKILN